jgi:hypothetical protein
MTQTLSPTSRRADPLLDAATYAPLPGSPCLGAASDGGSIGAVQPEPASVDQAEYDRVVQLNKDLAAAVAEGDAQYALLLAECATLREDLRLIELAAEYNYDWAIRMIAERDAALLEVARLRDALTRAGAVVMAALEPGL